jgi:outer membrane protein assembly factor BamA
VNALKFPLVRLSKTFPLLFLFLVALSPAQKHKSTKELPPSAFKLVSVQVSGTHRYKPEDVTRATGLQLGETVHGDNFGDAVRRLGDSGAFTDVAYTFDYAPEGTKLELQVKDAEHFAPARFENLVWFSDQELFEKLHSQVPLFDQELPVTGRLPDDVRDALQAMVDERKVPGQVDYTREAHEDGPTEAFVFSISGPRILIQNVGFSGANADELRSLESSSKSLRSVEYVRSKLLQQEEKKFLPVFLERGYLKAVFGNPEAKIAQSNEDETLVDVTFPVDPGAQYKLDGLIIAGYKAVPLDTLRQAIHVQPSQPADAVQLDKDIDAIKNLYGTHGYMDAKVRSTRELDDSRHTVTYRLMINEGDIFKMGDLEILGLESRAKDRLQNNWTLLTGETYNSGYTRRFVSQALKEVLTTGEWNTDIQETLDRKDKTVDVTLRFVARQ